MAGATADNNSTSEFNADTYQLPVLQFDPSQEKVIVNRELSPVVEEEGSNDTIKRTFMEGTASSTIPVGSIIYHSKDGITTVFDQTGKQILAAEDSQAEMMQTPVGLIPATHVHTVPSGSDSYASANATCYVYNNTVIWVTIHEKMDPLENPEGNTSVTDSSTFSGKTLNALSDGVFVMGAQVIESAVVNNPDFKTGDSFTSEWTVPQSPSRTGAYSPTYLSLGLDELGTTKINSNVYSKRQKVKSIIGYDYDQNAWFMTTCQFESSDSVNWDMVCVNNWPINPGDKIRGRVEYKNESNTNPPALHHNIQSYIWDLNTGLRLGSGASYTADTDTITQLNIILQGDLNKLDESSVVGGTTFSPVGFPVSPTIFAATSNSRLPHLRVGNLWPDKIVFHTLDAPEPEGYTFSTTEVLELPNASYQSAGFVTSQNVERWLGDKAGWKLLFNKSWANVTKAEFGSDGGGLNNATLHWHVGHGGTFDDGTSYLGLQDYPNSYLPASIVEKKWGGKNKWVVLVSCEVLSDENWGKALSTSHGIFGFKTSGVNNPRLPSAFFHYAMDENRTLYDSWRQATKDVLGGSTVYTKYIWINGTPEPDKGNGTEIPVSAGVMFKTREQLYNDHLPGYGTVEPDSDSNSSKVIPMFWNCSKNEV
jgi:hypothetical protein